MTITEQNTNHHQLGQHQFLLPGFLKIDDHRDMYNIFNGSGKTISGIDVDIEVVAPTCKIEPGMTRCGREFSDLVEYTVVIDNRVIGNTKSREQAEMMIERFINVH